MTFVTISCTDHSENYIFQNFKDVEQKPKKLIVQYNQTLCGIKTKRQISITDNVYVMFLQFFFHK